MKNRKLTRIIAITLTATVAATSVMPCGTVLGAQNDPVTEEAAETTESVQESEVSESEISEAEIQTETENETETEDDKMSLICYKKGGKWYIGGTVETE